MKRLLVIALLATLALAPTAAAAPRAGMTACAAGVDLSGAVNQHDRFFREIRVREVTCARGVEVVQRFVRALWPGEAATRHGSTRIGTWRCSWRFRPNGEDDGGGAFRHRCTRPGAEIRFIASP